MRTVYKKNPQRHKKSSLIQKGELIKKTLLRKRSCHALRD